MVHRRNSSLKSSVVVGLWTNSTDMPHKNHSMQMLDPEAIQWVAKNIAQLLQIQYLPSCRGPGKFSFYISMNLIHYNGVSFLLSLRPFYKVSFDTKRVRIDWIHIFKILDLISYPFLELRQYKNDWIAYRNLFVLKLPRFFTHCTGERKSAPISK